MKKFTCPLCGYVHKGEKQPGHCPQCKCPGKKFEAANEPEQSYDYIDEILVQMPDKPKRLSDIIIDVPAEDKPEESLSEDITEALELNFTAECTEVGMYLTMSRVAERDGFPEIAEAFRRIAFEEAGHAARFAELDKAYCNSTLENLVAVADTETAASGGKQLLAKMARDAGLDEIYTAVFEMSLDEERHAKIFSGLLKRYFGA